MHELDLYIEKDLKEFLDTMNTKVNETSKYTNSIKMKNEIRGIKRKMRWVKEKLHNENNPDTIYSLKQDLYKHIKNIKILQHKMRHRSTREANKKPLRLFYTRYADD